MMSDKEFLLAKRSMRICPPKKVIISGGEPTLWPLLTEAIKQLKEFVPIVEVISNGINRKGEDYGAADIVSISNYGSINKLDLIRLKKQLGRRFKMLNSCQVKLPIDIGSDNTMPAVCNCYNPSFVRGSVYACPVAGYNRLREKPASEYCKEYLRENEKIIFNMDICRNCLANFKARSKLNNNVILEVSGWNTRFSCLINFGRFSHLMRMIYRRLKGLR
jgi:hypothetical protein